MSDNDLRRDLVVLPGMFPDLNVLPEDVLVVLSNEALR